MTKPKAPNATAQASAPSTPSAKSYDSRPAVATSGKVAGSSNATSASTSAMAKPQLATLTKAPSEKAQAADDQTQVE